MKHPWLGLILSVAAVQAADLPVKQVVLYKHGVGFFERSGTLGPGESARIAAAPRSPGCATIPWIR